MSESVVATIAGIAAREVVGVLALSTETRTGDVHGRHAASDTVPGVVAVVAETQATIDLTLIAEYGTDLVELASRVRRQVTSAVLQMTTLRVSEVGITVVDVRVPSAGVEQPGRSR